MRDNPNFLRGLDERQVPYICAVESTFGCRLPHEVLSTAARAPVYQGVGSRASLVLRRFTRSSR